MSILARSDLLRLGMLAIALVLATGVAGAAPVAGKRPNIILVMTDDQGMGDLSCLGNPDIKTPNLDRLHDMSLRFTDFHVSPTCSPTRSAVMSGRHPFRNGISHTILERERMALSTVTLPQVLHSAGYATGIFGKWHLGDEEPYQPHNRGFEEVFIHGAGGIGQAYDCSCADAPPNQDNKYFDCVIRHNTKFVKTEGFCTDVFFRQALGWIKARKDDTRPFFVYLVPNAPHGPMIAPDKYKRPFLDAGFEENTAARYGMIVNIDDNMGTLIQKMAEWDLEEDTLLIFMTDNGQASGRTTKKNGETYALWHAGLRDGKGSPHEGGTRVPAFWRWKGVLPAGQDVAALARHIDLFPTLMEIAGATAPAQLQPLDGRSLVPVLEDQNAPWADRYLFIHTGRWPVGANVQEYKHKRSAVRSAQYRLVEDKELYDILADPGETKNIIDDHPEVVKAMRAAYDEWWEKTVPLLVNENVPMSPTRPFWVEYEKQAAAPGGIPKWVKPEI